MSNPDQISEAKRMTSNDTRYYNALMDLAGSLSRVFKRYARPTRKDAWKAIISKRGKKEVDRLLLDPNLPLTRFRKLSRSFKEWLDEQETVPKNL